MIWSRFEKVRNETPVPHGDVLLMKHRGIPLKVFESLLGINYDYPYFKSSNKGQDFQEA